MPYRSVDTPDHKPTARRIYHLPTDLLSFLLGRPDPLTQWKGKVFFDDGPSNEIGEESFRVLRHIVGLGAPKLDERVLGLGCGIDQIALTRYLSKRGSYEDFDASSKGISWCQENTIPRYPNVWPQFLTRRCKPP